MSKLIGIMSMSLDGYVADANDGVAEVFDWYFTSGVVEINSGGADASGPTPSRAEQVEGLTVSCPPEAL
jgi:hypothetical protein